MDNSTSPPVTTNGTNGASCDESQPTSATPTLDVSFERNGNSAAPPYPPTPPLWTHRLSASFSAMADQIAAASQALAQVPTNASINAEAGGPLAGVIARLEAIEKNQERLSAEFDALKEQFTHLNTEGSGGNDGNEEMEKKINDVMEMVKLEQSRLPARLHNSLITEKLQKMPIQAPATANGKPPPNFPATRGEFGHLTKERYESILKAYGQPVKGDVHARREALRLFIGLPA